VFHKEQGMKKVNETKFYQALERIFVGADVEGASGFVNLLKIKSEYYKIIISRFKKDVDNEEIIRDSFKEEFFDRLYSFFEKYFSESGSVYFVKTANWQKVYEQVYTDNRDVMLFWKTNMLYYVKSDILFQSMDVGITDDETGKAYKFFFDAGGLCNKQNNEKKEIVFTFKYIKEEDDGRIYVFDIAYSERGLKTKMEEVGRQTKLRPHILEKAFSVFKKQAEVDFFINKNAKKFLNEQLDIYLHQILLNTDNKFDQERLNQLKTVKVFAQKIIDFISQFEDELVRIWNKPKFALGSNYVITIDKLSSGIIDKLSRHPGLKSQIKEWQDLGIAGPDFDFAERSSAHKYLPVDTKHFKDLEIDILGLFDNLDEALDGRLIHSENYQALNTLQEKYKEKVQCIYIDPPFNKAESEQFSYIANYKDASWISLLENRLELSRKIMKNTGSIFVNTDDKCNTYIRLLLDSIFGNFQNEIIWCYEKPGAGQNKFKNNHGNIWFYTKQEKDYLFNTTYVPRKGETELTRRQGKFETDYEGKVSPDWWIDIPSFATAMTASERVGKMLDLAFPTQ
jgi:adenine-specific DNA-methyltransferase